MVSSALAGVCLASLGAELEGVELLDEGGERGEHLSEQTRGDKGCCSRRGNVGGQTGSKAPRVSDFATLLLPLIFWDGRKDTIRTVERGVMRGRSFW